MLRIQEEEERAAASQNAGEMVGARAVNMDELSIASVIMLADPAIQRIPASMTLALVPEDANMDAFTPEQHKQAHRKLGDLSPLEDAHRTYQEMTADTADRGVHEEQDHDYAAATFAGIHEAVAKKGGGVPIGCFQCEQPRPRYIAGSIWMRHDGDRHYLVFMDASGNCTEYRIWFCPFCGKKL